MVLSLPALCPTPALPSSNTSSTLVNTSTSSAKSLPSSLKFAVRCTVIALTLVAPLLVASLLTTLSLFASKSKATPSSTALPSYLIRSVDPFESSLTPPVATKLFLCTCQTLTRSLAPVTCYPPCLLASFLTLQLTAQTSAISITAMLYYQSLETPPAH